jgi:hypothetical protein
MQPRHAAPGHRSRRPARRLLLVGLLLGAAAALAVPGLPSGHDPGPRAAPAAAHPAGDPPVGVRPVGEAAQGRVARAATVLRGWDRVRAAAWARGSPAALRRLYVAGAGASDVRLLEAYRQRGLRVAGLRVQVLALDVVHHEPGRWLLRVTDRVAGGAAVGAGVREPLPRDRATTRTLRLVRPAGEWRMAAVGRAGSG